MLPDGDLTERLEGHLGALQDAMDGAHVVLHRASLARTLAEQQDEQRMRDAHLERLEPLAERWPGALRELREELTHAVEWVDEELQRIA